MKVHSDSSHGRFSGTKKYGILSKRMQPSYGMTNVRDQSEEPCRLLRPGRFCGLAQTKLVPVTLKHLALQIICEILPFISTLEHSSYLDTSSFAIEFFGSCQEKYALPAYFQRLLLRFFKWLICRIAYNDL